MLGGFCLPLLAVLATASGAGDTLRYVGTLRLGPTPQLVHLELDPGLTRPSGRLRFPLLGDSTVSLVEVFRDGSRWRLVWGSGADQTAFHGMRRGSWVSGPVQRGGARGTLDLFPSVGIDGRNLAAAGLYQTAPGHLLSLTVRGGRPMFLDFDSGRTRALFAVSDSEFVAGPAVLIPTPVELRVRVRPAAGEGAASLAWQWGAGPWRSARRLSFRGEPVQFSSGSVTLAGTLVLPRSVGPHPAVVRIHGAGPADRGSGAAEHYAYHGIAFLSYDKRGVGASTGDWRHAGVEDLADDALAAVRLLRSRTDIDPRRIGLGAGSEGGWVAAAVAARDSGLAFIALFAGPVLSYFDEILNETDDNLRARGLPEEQVRDAVGFRARVLSLLRSREALAPDGWSKVLALVDSVGDQPWLPMVRPPAALDGRYEKFAAMLPFDPMPFWRRTRIPVFALYGELDRNAPAARNAAALREAVRLSGNRDVSITVLPAANHEGMAARTGFLDEAPWLSRFVPGYFDLPMRWIRRHLGLSRGPPAPTESR